MSDGLSSLNRIFYGHFEAIIRIPPDDRLDSSRRIFWLSDNKRKIGFFYLMIMDEFLEFSKSNIIFRHYYETTRVFIEAVNNSRPIFSYLSVEIFHLSYELVNECSKSANIARCGVSIYSSIFTHNEKIIIFRDDFKRSVVWRES